jgi:cytochrome c oxidase cbb3-type subunit 3
MGNFSEGFWNLFLVVVVLGSIGGLWAFVVIQSKARLGDESSETTGHVWDEDLQEYNNPLPLWWKNMFYITLAFGVLYLILYPGLGNNSMLLGWTQLTQYEEEMQRAEDKYGPLFEQHMTTPIEALAGNDEAMRMGERLYASYCTQCHGSDARGVTGYPNLRDADWQWGGDAAQIKHSIMAGRNAVMPPWQAVLGDEGVKAVAAYTLSLSGREMDAAQVAAGQPLFATNCVACHGAEGKGNPALGAPNLTDGVWLYGGSPLAVQASLVAGRNGQMPAHGEFLGEAKVHLLSAYVYGLSRADAAASK